jgi:hypothetical protein
MRQSRRILFLGLFIAVLLSTVATTLLLTVAAGNAEASQRIGTVWGAAMGLAVPALALWWWTARRKENEKRNK